MPASDTSPQALRKQVEILRQLSLERHAEMVFELGDNLRAVLETGVRLRHPSYTAEEARLAAIRLTLGKDLFEKAYPGVHVEP